MKCDEVLALLGPLTDNELPTDTTAIVMEHLATCLPCQQEWDSNLLLNKQFQQLEDSILVPNCGLIDVDRRINALSSVPVGKPIVVAAAIVMVIGLLCLPFFTNHLTPRATILQQVLQTYPSGTAPIGSSDPVDLQMAKLSHHVKFKPSAFDLPGWSLASADVLHLPGHVCLLRMIYRADGPGPRTIVVYQSCQGQLKPDGLKKQIVAGRHLHCGRVNGLAVIHWSDMDRDHLFVSSLSEKDLMSLALHV